MHHAQCGAVNSELKVHFPSLFMTRSMRVSQLEVEKQQLNITDSVARTVVPNPADDKHGPMSFVHCHTQGHTEKQRRVQTRWKDVPSDACDSKGIWHDHCNLSKKKREEK